MTARRSLALVLGLAATAAAAAADDDDAGSELPDFAETTEGWTAHEGFLRLYTKEKDVDALRAAVPKDLLGQPFFLATSVAGGSTYAGWQWNDTLVRFERQDEKLLLVELNTRQRAADDAPLTEVVRRTYADRLLASLDILSIGPKEEVLIDLGALLVSDYRTFFGSTFGLDTSVAALTKTKAFPENCEIAVRAPLFGDGTFTTLYYSIASLPALDDYTPREADDRIGYFLTAIRDYTAGDPREGRMIRFVNRWKLEKADPDLALSPPKEPIVFYVEDTVPYEHRRAVHEGILAWNEAFEAIGIVGAIEVRQQSETQFTDLDPEDARYNFFRWITSERAFAMGPSRVDARTGRILDADIIFDDSMLRGYVRDYDVMIREEPEKRLSRVMAEHLRAHPEQHPLAGQRARAGDPAMARARALLREVLAPEEGAEAEAAAAAEPEARVDERRGSACRVGQGLPHELDLARLAAGELGITGARGPAYDEFIAQVVKETVMHEVGHTLGLRHNFKASSWLDLDAINDEDAPVVTSASVMDYHPINLSVREGRPQGRFLTGRVGPYDRLAIEYGYALVEEGSEELAAIPRRMAAEGLPYATDEDTGSPDPLITRWDMGDDPIEYAEYRMALVRELWADLIDRAVDDDESYSRLRQAFDMTLYEVQRAATTASSCVGGLRFVRDHRGDPNAREPISVVEADQQRAALEWVCDNVFAPDAFEFSPDLLKKLAASRWSHWGSSDRSASLDYPLLDRLNAVQTWGLFFLTADDVLARLWESEQLAGPDEDVLTLPELFDALEAAIFAELEDPGAGTNRDPVVSAVRQNLQDAYVRRLIAIALGNGISPPVANKLAWSRLKGLEQRFQGALARELDDYTRAHLEALHAKSEAARTADYVHIASGGCGLARADEAPASAAWLGLLALGGGLVVLRRSRSGRA